MLKRPLKLGMNYILINLLFSSDTSLCMCILPYIIYMFCKPLNSICLNVCILFGYAFSMDVSHDHVLLNVNKLTYSMI